MRFRRGYCRQVARAAKRCFQDAAGTKSFRRVRKDFRAAIATNSDYSNHYRSVVVHSPILYLVNFRHTLRSDHRDEMAQLVFDIAGRCNCLSNFLSQ